jgi:tetratricopeptide (TPR) repeat protein
MSKFKPLPNAEKQVKEGWEDSRPVIRLSLPLTFLKFIPIFLLILATLLVYWPVLNAEFINFDDNVYIIDNLNIQRGLTLENVIWAFTNTSAGFWQPLTWLSHMLDCQLFGLNPGGHHLTSLFFHLANTLLLFWVLKRMTGRPWASIFVAALFALHPLHVESVAWVSERKDVLSTFFWILTMGTYLRYVEQPGIHRYLLVLLSFTLGLMSKTMLVTLPFVLLLLDYWPLGRFLFKQDSRSSLLPRAGIAHNQGLSLLHLVREKIPLWILSGTWCVLTFFAEKSVGAIDPLGNIPLGIRLANAISSNGFYLERMIWPRNLAVYYPYPDMIPLLQVIMSGLLLVGLSFIVIRYALSHPYLFVGWFWYLGTLVPVIGLVPVGSHAMADRYTYVPLIGLFIMIAMGLPDLLKEWRHQKIVMTVSAGLVLSFLGLASRQQVSLWHNSITLFEHTLTVTAKNFIIHNNLGIALAQQGKIQEAMFHYSQALRIKPDYADAHINLGNFLAQQGKIQEAAAHYTQALRSNPNSWQGHYSLAGLQAQQGKIQEAISSYSRALQIEPDFAEAHYILGIILTQQGNNQEAIAHYTQALQIKRDYAEAHNNLAQLLERQGKIHEAITHYQQTLRFKPDYAGAHYNLGNLLFQQGKIQEAAHHYSHALQINPNSAEIHNNLGNALAQEGKIQEATSHFTQALQINPNFAEAHNNLGNVLAQQGKIQEAANHYSQALRINPYYAEAHYSLGEFLVRQGKLQEGIFHLTQALRTKPDLAEAHFSLGIAYLRTGNREWAMEEHKILKTINPDMANALYKNIFK